MLEDGNVESELDQRNWFSYQAHDLSDGPACSFNRPSCLFPNRVTVCAAQHDAQAWEWKKSSIIVQIRGMTEVVQNYIIYIQYIMFQILKQAILNNIIVWLRSIEFTIHADF